MEKLNTLARIGQSLWYDNIQRSMLQNGDIARMIVNGEIKGMTSNPSIFQNAIVNSTDYDRQLQTLSWTGASAEEIFWKLAIEDVQNAADLFKDIYERSGKQDGYVSLEVNPNLAHDARGTVREALDLWKRVNRQNLMIKVPATPEGVAAIRELIRAGININVTLIFGTQRYKDVIEAYLAGLEDRISDGEDIAHVTSVASVFVSRIDTKVDSRLKEIEQASDLSGKTAVHNSRLIYQIFLNEFSKPRASRIREKSGKVQKPLWASTSTKNPDYRDVLYVEELIGKDTVNTVPPATLSAFLDHGIVSETLTKDFALIEPHFERLSRAGISIDEVTQSLENEGVKAFIDAYHTLIAVIEQRRTEEIRRLGNLFPKIQERVRALERENFVNRLFEHDPNLWTRSEEGQKEIIQRMDWLEAPWETHEIADISNRLLDELNSEGFTNVLILGMGGSSLAPEVFSKIQAKDTQSNGKGLKLSILDSTHPDEVLRAAAENPVKQTVFVVSSKSGTTGEINAFFDYFYDVARKELGEKAGSHFVAITDPGTKLENVAREKKFRRIITANPRVGGRNSAITAFGLVPASLFGIDTSKMMAQTVYDAKSFRPDQDIAGNPGVTLGAILGEAVLGGQDKLTILADDEWQAFSAWMEQLIAESSGKNGKGILPIAEEPFADIGKFSNDRLFVYLRKNGQLDEWVKQLTDNGRPVLVQNVKSALDLAYQFYLWEVATATVCSILGVNSFDQPDVQDAKTRTLAGIESYRKTGQFIIDAPKLKTDDFLVYSNQKFDLQNMSKPLDAVLRFVSEFCSMGSYVAINAFIHRDEKNTRILTALRETLLEEFSIATTLGFGPRYLHSTGQLHKGGPDNGLFLILTNTPAQDVPIPGEEITFGKFCFAQALGDESALLAHGRKVMRIHFNTSEISFN